MKIKKATLTIAISQRRKDKLALIAFNQEKSISKYIEDFIDSLPDPEPVNE